jgi:hypothetical protein
MVMRLDRLLPLLTDIPFPSDEETPDECLWGNFSNPTVSY